MLTYERCVQIVQPSNKGAACGTKARVKQEKKLLRRGMGVLVILWKRGAVLWNRGVLWERGPCRTGAALAAAAYLDLGGEYHDKPLPHAQGSWAEASRARSATPGTTFWVQGGLTCHLPHRPHSQAGRPLRAPREADPQWSYPQKCGDSWSASGHHP